MRARGHFGDRCGGGTGMQPMQSAAGWRGDSRQGARLPQAVLRLRRGLSSLVLLERGCRCFSSANGQPKPFGSAADIWATSFERTAPKSTACPTSRSVVGFGVVHSDTCQSLTLFQSLPSSRAGCAGKVWRKVSRLPAVPGSLGCLGDEPAVAPYDEWR